MRIVIHESIKEKTDYASLNPPFEGFKVNHLFNLIRYIQIATSHNQGKLKNDYVTLCAKYLRDVVHDYEPYLHWMQDNEILTVNKQFIVGKMCRQYKLIMPQPTYGEDLDVERFRQVQLKTTKGISKVTNSAKNSKGIEFLYRHLSRLTIDERQAYDISESIFQQDLKTTRYKNKKGKYSYYQAKVNPLVSLNHRKNSIVSIAESKFMMTRDETSGRVHTNLTSLTSALFPTLRYNDAPLIGYDIANSQPFLLAVLINYLINLDDSEKGKPFKIQSKHHYNTHNNQYNNTNTPYQHITNHKSTLNQYLHHYTKSNIPKIFNTIMIVKKEETLDMKEIELFIECCCSGGFYKEMAKHVFECEYTPNESRKIKDFVFTLLFTKPGNNKGGVSKFKKRFSSIHKLICGIKNSSDDPSFLPVLLQSLESYYIIERVCKRINKENPRMPLYTKHDSIYTIPKHKEKLRLIMEEEAITLFSKLPVLRES